MHIITPSHKSNNLKSDPTTMSTNKNKTYRLKMKTLGNHLTFSGKIEMKNIIYLK